MGRLNEVSLNEWLASWGDGPHWADNTGQTVPIAKSSLAELIDDASRMRAALEEIRDWALNRAPGSTHSFSSAVAASLATICERALEDK